VSEITNPNWQGATKLVNMRKALTWGGWFVAEYRLRNMSKWMGAIFAFGLGQPVLFLLSIGIGIGALVDKGSGGTPMDGVGYLVFLAPALLATAAIQGAMDEVTFPTLQGFVWDKSFFAMNSTQLSGSMIVQGIMIASAIRCLFTVFMYEVILLAFGAIKWESLPALTWASSLAGISFASVMLGVTSFVKQDDGFFAIVGRFIITPLFMFSGTYYPLETLPTPLQAIGWVSPVWHSTNLGRVLSYGHEAPSWLIAIHYAFMAVLFITGLIVATKKFEKRLAA
jgi:lipooligosaccharide transport system permease protein